jgi:hypothetical protein
VTDINTDNEQTVISTDDARGALGPNETSKGDTMLPTLIVGSVLAIIAVGAVWWIF